MQQVKLSQWMKDDVVVDSGMASALMICRDRRL